MMVPGDNSTDFPPLGYADERAIRATDDSTRGWQALPALLAANAPVLRLLAQQWNGALWTTDGQLCLTSWHGASLTAQLEGPALAVGRGLAEVFGSSDPALRLIAAHRTALQGAVESVALEHAGRRFQADVVALRNVQGQIRGVVGLARDISEQSRMQQELRQVSDELDRRVEARTAEIRRLYEQEQEAAVLQERQRLARDLHDAVTQMLFSASLIAEVLPRIWARDQDKARQHLEDLRMLTRGALAEMRTLLLDLRPAALDESRLGDLIQQASETLMGKIGIPVSITVRDTRVRRVAPLPLEVRTTLYRVVQEALNNIAKHARATHVTITLDQQPGQVGLAIHDDGTGFDLQQVTADHLGLGIMQERVATIGGTLTIESQSGGGTVVRVQWTG